MLFREIIEIADDASGNYVTNADGQEVVNHENIQRSRLRVDAHKSAARLAPKKYGDHISHDVKGPGANFQPAILITVDGQPHDEFARQLAYDEDGDVLLDGNGDIVRAR
jgi:Bacteriophage Sf6, terminase small subunit-like